VSRLPIPIGRLATALSVGVALTTGGRLDGQALREIGRTAAGNPVLVESRTVRRDSSQLHATIRVRFAKPVRTGQGNWWSSRTKLTFNCGARQVKVLENWYYGDTTWRRVVSHNVVGIPAFGPVIGGSMTSVGYDTLCPVKPPSR
jgi:hypothetical protein